MLESIKINASELNEIAQLEKEILKELVQVTNEHLSGCWVHSRNCTSCYDIKIKVNGYHLLVSVINHSVVVELIKSVPETRKGKIIEFTNTILARGWQSARQYISLADVVNECHRQMLKKIADAKKTNLNEINKKITEIKGVV